MTKIDHLFAPASPAPALPALLQSMQFDADLLDREPRPVDLIDGHLIPRGNTTLIATDAGSGKSTSALVSGISAAYDGNWTMFGTRKHDNPQKVAIVLGEDNDRSFETVLSGLPDSTKEQLKAARLSGNLFITPFRKWARSQEQPDFFDSEGKYTATGQQFVAAMRQFRPDVLVLDTITSLSECPYMDKNHAYRTVNLLNDLADELNCAVLVMMHLVKDGGRTITDKVTADDLIAKVSGSAGWSAASRHVISMAPCPVGKFDNIQLTGNDTKWIAAVKTNLLPDAAKEVFPVIRSRKEMMLKTVDDAGKPLLETDAHAEKSKMKELKDIVLHAIEAAARLRSPFTEKRGSKFSIEKQFNSTLSDFPERATEAQWRRAVELLEYENKIVPCSASRAGGSVVWDVPHGDFANQARYEAETNSKLEFRKGAPEPKVLFNLMLEIKNEKESSDE